MRILFVFASIAAGILLLYKWRYRLLVFFLAFVTLRKIMTIVSKNMTTIKQKLIPILCNKQETIADS